MLEDILKPFVASVIVRDMPPRAMHIHSIHIILYIHICDIDIGYILPDYIFDIF